MNKKLSTKSFIFSQLLILSLGLATIFVISFYMNVQKKGDKLYSPGGGPVTTIPTTLTLELLSPEADSLVFQPSVIVSGNTLPNSTVLISSDTQNIVIQSKFDGSFSTVLDLVEGVNNLTVAVFSLNGDQRSVARSVYYSKEKI